MRHEPPRVAVLLLTRRLAEGWRDFVLGDLEEEFQMRCEASPAAARRWFWWQTIRCLAAPPPAHPAPSHPHLGTRHLGTRHRGTRHPGTQHPAPAGDPMLRTLAADFRYSLPDVAARAVVHDRGRRGPGARHRRQHRHLQHRQHGAAARCRSTSRIGWCASFTCRRRRVPGCRASRCPPRIYDWRRDARLFDRMALYRFRSFTLTGGGSAEGVVAGAVATGSLGTFRPSRCSPRVPSGRGRRRGAAMSWCSARFLEEPFRRRARRHRPHAHARRRAYTVVGVMPPAFRWRRGRHPPRSLCRSPKGRRSGGARQPQRCRDRPLETRCRSCAGGSGDEGHLAEAGREYPKENTG